MKRLWTHLSRRVSADDRGFSLPEVIITMIIGMIVTATVTTVIASTMTVTADSQLTAGAEMKAQRVLSSFSDLASEAVDISAASPQGIIFNYRSATQCEHHVYSFTADPVHDGRVRLHHTVTALKLAGNADCTAVSASLADGSVPASSEADEIDDLSPASAFAYYANTGQVALTPGDSGYSPENSIPTCMLGSVSLTLHVKIITSNNRTDRTEMAQAAFNNNMRGLGCN